MSKPETSNTSFITNAEIDAQERDRDGVAPKSTTRRPSWGKKGKEAIYVYDYSKDKIERIKDGGEFKKQIGKQPRLESSDHL